jgi:hypothetical protein
MKAAILCPGPSLQRAIIDGHDLTIGVNRAAAFTSCDVWAAGDIPMLTDHRPKVIGSPELLTAANTAAYLRDHATAWPGKVTEFEDLFGFLDPHALPWTLFTFTASIVFAAWRGATEIDVHGCDWRGLEDFDGWAQAGNRSDERWKLESQIYARLADTLAGRGVTVRRNQSEMSHAQ